MIICIGTLLFCFLLLAGTIPTYCVEVGTAKVYFLSKKRAEKFYEKQKAFYEECEKLIKDIREVREEIYALT